MMDKFAEDAHACLDNIRKSKAFLNEAMELESSVRVRSRIKTDVWITRFAELQVEGLYYQLKGNSSFSNTQVTAGIAKALDGMGMPENSYAETVVPMASETLDNLKKALSKYSEAITFTQSLEDIEKTVWIQSKTAGFIGLQQWALMALNEQIKTCNAIINR